MDSLPVMDFSIATAVFYVFAAMTLISGLMVITARNPVHAVFFLILAFFNSAGLFVLLGAEYIAMTLVIVYVGAVAVLFLFVVMMLDINFTQLREGMLRYLPLGGTVALVVFAEMMMVFMASLKDPRPKAMPSSPIPMPSDTSNTEAIGNLLYTNYVYLFQIAGLILLVAMIGAIVLTLRNRGDVRRQNIGKQVNRTRAESVTLVKVKSGEGI